MKKYYLLVLLLFAAKPLLAQVANLEEIPLPVLKKKLAEIKNDTGKVQLQLAVGRAILFKSSGGNKEIDSALSFADQALKLSRQIAYNDGIVNSMLLSALSFNKKNNPELGFKISQQALAFSEKVNDSYGMAESYIVIGQHYEAYTPSGLLKRMDYYNKAIIIFREKRNLLRLATTLKDQAELLFLASKKADAIKLLFEALNIDKVIDYKRIEGIYWLIGRTSNDLGDFPNALNYNLLAIRTAKEVKDTTLQLCSIYTTTASTYINMTDNRKALFYSLMALEIARRYNDPDYIITVSIMVASEYTRINQLAKGLAALEEVKKYATSDQDRLIVLESIFNDLTYAKQYSKAKSYLKEIKRLLAKIPPDNFDYLLTPYNFLSYYYVRTKEIDSAYLYTSKYAEIVNKVHFALGIRAAEKHYYLIDSMKGDFKSAIKHYLIAQKIRDSLDNVTKAYQISLLQMENDTEKKNNDIDTLTKQAQVEDDELKRNRLIQSFIIGGSMLLLIISGLVYSRYRLKKRSNVLLMQQKSEIDEQNVALQHLVHDKNLLIGDKDELLHEKDLLLKEVNHRVKNNLQIVMSLLESQSGYMQNKKAQEAILESQNRVQSIALIHEQLFHTDKIAEIDLASYITELVQSLDYSINKGRHKVNIHCNVDDIQLDVSQAIPVGIILNESVTNALKYAFPGDRTGEIVVMVKQIEQRIEIQISDNGVGLPDDFSLSKTNSLGITLIKGLTGQLKGTFNIDNSAGVTITVKFPVEVASMAGTVDGLVTEIL